MVGDARLKHLCTRSVALVLIMAAGCGEKEPEACTLELLPFDELPAQDEPDPLINGCKEPVTNEKGWRSRRTEIFTLFRHYMYGYEPAPPDNLSAVVANTAADLFAGKATRKLVDLIYGPAGAPVLHLLLVVPNDRAGPAPVFLGPNFYGNHAVLDDPEIPLTDVWVPHRAPGQVNNRATEASRGTAVSRWAIESSIDRGYAVATFYHGDLDPDWYDFTDGIHPFYAKGDPTDRGLRDWGTIAAWSWGVHRTVDYLVTDPDIDSSRIAVMGHSRNGKVALWAGALDERIALVVSNQSGCSGAALSRRRNGETLYWLNELFGHWFALAYHQFNDHEERLPFDQHFLISLIAPRPVLIASAAEDAWADPRGEFLSARAADPVFRLLGVEGLEATEQPPTSELVDSRLGYHLRPGDHGVGPEDWAVFLDFADLHL